jgi:hypothetical protein
MNRTWVWRTGGMILKGKNLRTQRKTCTSVMYLAQIPHESACNRTRASVVRNRRLRAWGHQTRLDQTGPDQNIWNSGRKSKFWRSNCASHSQTQTLSRFKLYCHNVMYRINVVRICLEHEASCATVSQSGEQWNRKNAGYFLINVGKIILVSCKRSFGRAYCLQFQGSSPKRVLIREDGGRTLLQTSPGSQTLLLIIKLIIKLICDFSRLETSPGTSVRKRWFLAFFHLRDESKGVYFFVALFLHMTAAICAVEDFTWFIFHTHMHTHTHTLT